MAILICIIHDERVEWYEALILVLLYIIYIAVMYYDKSIQKCARGKWVCLCVRVFHGFVGGWLGVRLCVFLCENSNLIAISRAQRRAPYCSARNLPLICGAKCVCVCVLCCSLSV